MDELLPWIMMSEPRLLRPSAAPLRAIEGVGIVQPDGQVKHAVRVEELGAVDALGHLAVSFAKLWP